MSVVMETCSDWLVLFQDGEVQDGSELIGPAEPFSDFLADSLSDCSAEGEGEWLQKCQSRYCPGIKHSESKCYGDAKGQRSRHATLGYITCCMHVVSVMFHI